MSGNNVTRFRYVLVFMSIFEYFATSVSMISVRAGHGVTKATLRSPTVWPTYKDFGFLPTKCRLQHLT